MGRRLNDSLFLRLLLEKGRYLHVVIRAMQRSSCWQTTGRTFIFDLFLQEITQFTKSLFLEVLNEMCTEITKEAIDKVLYTSQSNLSCCKTRGN